MSVRQMRVSAIFVSHFFAPPPALSSSATTMTSDTPQDRAANKESGFCCTAIKPGPQAQPGRASAHTGIETARRPIIAPKRGNAMMANDQMIADSDSASLTIGKIGVSDLKDALIKGYDDFTVMPSHAVFLCVIYPIVGLMALRIVTGDSLLPLLFPLTAGYALMGPFAAVGLYELSRRRELGLDPSPSHIFEVLRSPGIGSIAALGVLLT